MTAAAPDTLIPPDLFAAAKLVGDTASAVPARFVVGVDDADLPPSTASARIAPTSR